jgi:hypothetical protein
MSTSVFIPVSVGELIDKLTILQIKMDRITDPVKVMHVASEMRCLLETHDAKGLIKHTDYDDLFQEMLAINQTIWDLEDEMHELMRHDHTTDAEFGRVSVQIHHNNDLRAQHKLTINRAFNSTIIEQKSYEEIK